ncbi:sensor domain-containing diguanylate cyclase [Pseudoalteromonas sp. MMG012]|uniref:sensor domain-containing diguanylate cyclase n=1 Tax=Pseudoalteromonas sp. MMG012 TaxID=2822686 RepID=UPI001B3A3069|nr:sensor domain-containing diguanylate cyclase [Pseudoalteromonas sp. MMG012]MBQ4849626.1 sensor domain-containing diguanylate cyclase [Pseudoalteromonas sp. MMG012]
MTTDPELLQQTKSQETLAKWQKTIDLMARVFNAPAGFIVQAQEAGFSVLVANKNSDNPYSVGGLIPLETNIFCKKVVAENAALYERNASINPEWDSNPEVSEDGFESYLGVPIHWPDGSAFGTLCVMDFKITSYDISMVELIEHLRDMLEDDLILMHRFSKMRTIAMLDPLTNIYNRRAVVTLAEHKRDIALKMALYFYCIFIDLDDFKAVNDQYGHTTGDKVLSSIAQAITSVSRDDDLAGRLGGDEFLMFVQGPNGEWISELMKRLEEQFELLLTRNALPKVTFSYGSAVTDEKFIDLEQLIAQADKSMYQAKTARRKV